MNKKSMIIVIGTLVLASILLAACAQPETIEVIKTVIVTEIVEGEVVEVVVTEVVEVEVEVEVPAAAEEVSFVSPDPDTFVEVRFGDIDTLDPAWNYESFGDGFLEDIYDQLVSYKGASAADFSPELATSWDISDDGMTYVFHIREGVKFHEGQDLTAEDVAYSFQRGLLQGGGWSPQWLYTEAFFGIGMADVADLVDSALADDPEGLAAADPALLEAACQQVLDGIVADDAAGTVTFNLAIPWGPMLSTIAGSWGSVLDKDWAIEHGTWDGDCTTWQNYYGISSETTPLRDVANGTGPYALDHWTPGEEVALVANEDYWRTEPAFEGGPTGAPRLKNIITLEVQEWGTRFAMAQAGDADMFGVPQQSRPQVDPLVSEWCDFVSLEEWDCHPTDNPNGPFRVYVGMPATSRADAFFTFNLTAEGNPYIGSGQLDGNGIPPNFFDDVNMRKAFNFCFDWDSLIQDGMNGEGVQNYGPINPGMIGSWTADDPHYYYDEEKCIEHLKLAHDGLAWENGFRLSVGYNTGNIARQTACQILQANLRRIDPKFQVEIVAMPWPAFLAQVRASMFPMFFSGWGEDIHDPHNWVQPFMIGTYAARQGMPDWMLAEFKALVDAGVVESDPAKRTEIYNQLNQLDYDYAPRITMAVATIRNYQQRWVSDYVRNAQQRFPYYWYDEE